MPAAAQRVVDATANWIAGGRVGRPPYPGASTALFDLLFSHFTGIILTSVVVTAVYAAARRNRPQVFAEALLPASATLLVADLHAKPGGLVPGEVPPGIGDAQLPPGQRPAAPRGIAVEPQWCVEPPAE